MRQQNGCRLSIYFPFLLVDGEWPCVLSPSVSRRRANTVTVCYTSEASVDSEQEEACPSCLQSTHSFIHPPIGSEINPFSDRRLVASGLSNRASGCWPWRGQQSGKKKKKSPPLPWSMQKDTKWNKTKTEAIGSIEAHLHESHPLSGCLCVSVWLSATRECLSGVSWGLLMAGVCFLPLLSTFLFEAHRAAGTF